MPVFSVIMNCLNGEKFLKKAIDSVYSQTFKDWEIIFFDSGSIDNSVKIASSYDSKVKIFEIENPIPLGQARQEAVDKANGDYLAFLDVDDVWLDFKLELQLQLMKSGDFILSYGASNHIDEKDNFLFKNIPFHKTGKLFTKLLKHNEGNFCTYVIDRKKMISKGISFNPKLRSSCEEDMYIRLLAYEGKGIVTKKIIANYREVQGSVTSINRNIFYDERMTTLNSLRMENPDITTRFIKEFNSAKARAFYYKASYCMDTNKYSDAMLAINEAIKLDKSYRIFTILIKFPFLWNLSHKFKSSLGSFWLFLNLNK